MTAIMPIPNNDRIYGVYRVECSGILEILIVLNILCKHCSITQEAINLGFDGLSALQSIMLKTKERYSLNGEHSSIISLALHLKEFLPIEIKATYISGHQDEHAAFEILSRLEHMNVRMDAMAKYIFRHVKKDT